MYPTCPLSNADYINSGGKKDLKFDFKASLRKIGIMVEVAESRSGEESGTEEEDLDTEASSTSLCIIM